MRAWHRRLRGALGIGLCWAVMWSLVGGFLMEGIFDTQGRILDMWPQLLGVAGFLGGVIFSLLVGIVGRGRALDDFSLAEFSGLGAIAGALLGAIGLLTGGPALVILFAILGSSVAGAATLGLARTAGRLLGGRDRDQAELGGTPRGRIGALFALLFTAPALGAQATPAVLDSIASAPVIAGRAVGMVAAVTRGPDTLLFKAYGTADAEWDVPMVRDAVFEVGSITKQFTAAAILKLRDAGKLSLDDDLTKWLPDFDTQGHQVPLRRLLDHTSGIHDLTETPEFPALVSNRVWPRDSAYALIKRQPFDFAPGTRQQYSNSGFWLLGLVIEKASGMSFEEYLETQLFAPLGMTRSMHCTWFERVKGRAHGHGMENRTVYRGPVNIHTWSFGAGAVCSTAGDLITWLRSLHGGKVLSAASYAEMVAPSRLLNGMPLRYGYGVGTERDPMGRRVINHGGINAGFRSEALWYPESETAIVVLINNTGGIDPEIPARQMARALLPAVHPTASPPADLAPLVGRYEGATLRGPMTIEVTRGDSGLLVSGNGSSPRPLNWVEGRTWYTGEMYLAFGPGDASRPVQQLGFNPAKGLMMVLERTR